MYKYISDANVFMTYLPLAEKILDSIKYSITSLIFLFLELIKK